MSGTRLKILFCVTPERYKCSYPFCFLFSLFSTAKHGTNPASSSRHAGKEGEKTIKSHRDREGEARRERERMKGGKGMLREARSSSAADPHLQKLNRAKAA